MTEEEYKGLKQLRDLVGQAEKGTKDTGEKHRAADVYEAHHLIQRARELLDGAVKRVEKEGVEKYAVVAVSALLGDEPIVLSMYEGLVRLLRVWREEG